MPTSRSTWGPPLCPSTSWSTTARGSGLVQVSLPLQAGTQLCSETDERETHKQAPGSDRDNVEGTFTPPYQSAGKRHTNSILSVNKWTFVVMCKLCLDWWDHLRFIYKMKTKVRDTSGISHIHTNSEMRDTDYMLIFIPGAHLIDLSFYWVKSTSQGSTCSLVQILGSTVKEII